MLITNLELKKILVTPGHITEEQFLKAEKKVKNAEQELDVEIVNAGLIKDHQLGQLIAEAIGIPFINMQEVAIDDKLLNQIPELVARKRGVIAYKKTTAGIAVGMRNPLDLELRSFLAKRLSAPVIPYYITAEGLATALLFYRKNISATFEELLATLNNEKIQQDERDTMAMKMVDMLLQYGYESNTSDIHIEPYREKIVARFRIDGVMHDVLDLPKRVHETILARLKIMARMRTDEHRVAQDGKFRFTVGKNDIDARISVVPVTEGENVVVRILSAHNRQFGLADLGLGKKDEKKVNDAIKDPHGMILVTGPTGSGKTTTVYAVLKILNKREVHISTIEDPVEFDIEGISQIQVDTRTELTFAKGLRAIVRQDPDIIMVGEIRDEETAKIAVNSAMTGHLVLSTLHANDAPTTLPRLLDMGIEPFLISSTVNIVIAQRLVRKICTTCRASSTLSAEELAMLKQIPNIDTIISTAINKTIEQLTVFRGKGCKVCGDTGYHGRIGVFEVLQMSERIRQAIVARATSEDIRDIARAEGMITMLEDGIGKVSRGETTIEEILRVAAA